MICPCLTIQAYLTQPRCTLLIPEFAHLYTEWSDCSAQMLFFLVKPYLTKAGTHHMLF